MCPVESEGFSIARLREARLVWGLIHLPQSITFPFFFSFLLLFLSLSHLFLRLFDFVFI